MTTMKLLSPRDAGRLLGVTTARVQQLAREGKLPEIRDSAGRRLFRQEDVERLKREQERARQRNARVGPEPAHTGAPTLEKQPPGPGPAAEGR